LNAVFNINCCNVAYSVIVWSIKWALTIQLLLGFSINLDPSASHSDHEINPK